MAATQQKDIPVRHPWIESFLADPDRQFAELLAGHARIQPYASAEVPDAARMLFGPLAPGDVARTKLDQALNDWLNARRCEGVLQADRPRLDRWLGQIMDALEIVRILSLPQTAADLRQRFPLWQSWAARLREFANPDVQAEIFRTMALTQRLVQKTRPDSNQFALEPMWLQLCERAGSHYPASYLSIGLLGLRVLPERKDVPNERPWMMGLALWACTQEPTVERFSQEWWALKTLYQLTTPGHWRAAVSATLGQEKIRANIAEELRTFWQKDVGLDTQSSVAGQSQSGTPDAVARLLPDRADREKLLDRIRSGAKLSEFESELKTLMNRYERHAVATGDSSFLIRSATNLGNTLLKSGPAAERTPRGKLAVKLARDALAWSSTDAFMWGLWSDGLSAQGLDEAAERVAWYAVHRFPEDPLRWTKLATVLAGFPDRHADAESLLRQAHARFPTNDIVATQLADALIAHGEAEAVAEAQTLLEQVVARSPDDKTASAKLRQIGDRSRIPAKKKLASPLPAATAGSGLIGGDSVPEAILRGGRVRQLLAELLDKKSHAEWRAKALTDVDRFLKEDENLAFARYLKSELVDDAASVADTVNVTFVAAFSDAMKRKDPQRLKELETRYPEQSQLFDMTRAFLFQDRASAGKVIAWLSGPASRSSRRVAALRGLLVQQFGKPETISGTVEQEWRFTVGDPAVFLDLIAANDNVRLALLDAALVPADLALAA